MERVVAALLVALLAACGEGESRVPTREVCDQLAVATCRQYIEQRCDASIDPAQIELYCDDESLGGLIEGVTAQQCCVYLNCDGGREITESEVQACLDEVDTWYGCEQIEDGLVPQVCWGTIGAAGLDELLP